MRSKENGRIVGVNRSEVESGSKGRSIVNSSMSFCVSQSRAKQAPIECPTILPDCLMSTKDHDHLTTTSNLLCACIPDAHFPHACVPARDCHHDWPWCSWCTTTPTDNSDGPDSGLTPSPAQEIISHTLVRPWRCHRCEHHRPWPLESKTSEHMAGRLRSRCWALRL